MVPQFGSMCNGFRELLRPLAEFYWDVKFQELFEEARDEVVKKVDAGVKMFELDRVTCLATDWWKEGVGLFMIQKYCSCHDIKMGCRLSLLVPDSSDRM